MVLCFDTLLRLCLEAIHMTCKVKVVDKCTVRVILRLGRWVQFVNDTVLSAISAPNLTDSGSKLITITIPAGFGLGGTISSFTVTSGVVIGYRA
jgi:hypothetical protein